MVLLFQAALRHIRTAATALEAGRAAEANTPLAKASDIVAELMSTLDHSKSPQLCAQLMDIYMFVADRLITGAGTKSAPPVREAERVFAPVAEAFATAVASLQGPSAK
jgi:flagellar biosynthetic protein FliS